MGASSKRQPTPELAGRLRIGDDWNAINIIALSQSNPLKAVAEFVENSIDAGATTVKIIRGRDRGEAYLKIIDDGRGIPLDDEGMPNFKYVATHICDSIKRQLKSRGVQGIQGEFGIGLLSFWTVGETLHLVSAAADGKSYEMRMAKGDPKYSVSRLRRLAAEPGVELTIQPLLPGIRHFSGEKLQWYLASELRDRIRSSGVKITIVDRHARTEFQVEPRVFSGQLLHHLPCPATSFGDCYVEIYVAEPSPENHVSLYRSGTRVLDSVADLEDFGRPPWTSGYIQGVLDVPYLNLTPGTRAGVIRDERFVAFIETVPALEAALDEIIQQQRQAAEEQTNRDTLRSIQRAFREALLALPREEYDWFDVHGDNGRTNGRAKRRGLDRPGLPVDGSSDTTDLAEPTESATAQDGPLQREFFEHAGPLFSVRIAPATCTLPVRTSRTFRAVARDRGGRQVERDLVYRWTVVEGSGELTNGGGEIAKLIAPEEPQLIKLAVYVTQGDAVATAEALITVTDSLLPDRPKSDSQRGLPEYTFEKRPGELWRSRYDELRNVIVVNNGHRDFVYAARTKTLMLRYVCRLFAKELVLRNFPGYTADQLLERMIELSIYTEENLR